MKELVREMLHKVPFQLFIIHMADGRWFKVEDPAYVMASPKSRSEVLVEATADRTHHLPAAQIVGVEPSTNAVSAA